MNSKQKKYSFLESKAKIEYFCAYQERSHQEVRNKLYDYGLATDQVDNLISDLITDNFLNEERFADAYASGKFRMKKWGKIKIKLNLKQKRVSDYSIRKALANIDEEDYLQCIVLLVEKKHLASTGNKWEKRKKTMSFLLNKGFEADLVKEELDRKFPL